MITKVQGKTLAGEIGVRREPCLTPVEKAMLKWVVVDPEDRLLDANIGSGSMAEYLRRNMPCDVCGVSENMEDVRKARSKLRGSDIVYASGGEIPWKDDAFDTVLFRMDGSDRESTIRRLKEVRRVLRPGGQLVVGALCLPWPMASLATKAAEERLEEKYWFSKKELAELLEALAYEGLSWQRTGLGTGVMTAWKHKPDAREAFR